ncbi:hypothetical protein MAP00_007234 [Monascus purpureus]|nr:hypothetical protein MAP00_007234 [Monascus purpureus]
MYIGPVLIYPDSDSSVSNILLNEKQVLVSSASSVLCPFSPSFKKTWVRKSSCGISIFYLLFNLVSTTEHFTLFFFSLVNAGNSETPIHMFRHHPPNVGDWFNFAQISMVWLLFLFLLVNGLYFQSAGHTLHKTAVVMIYIFFLGVTIIPEFVDAIIGECSSDHQWALEFFISGNRLFILPATTILRILAIPFQAYMISHQPWPSSSLSLTTLAAQAVIFFLVAVSWIMRVPYPHSAHYPPVTYLDRIIL